MRLALALACIAVVVVAGAGCRVGDGSGTASGSLFVEGCLPRDATGAGAAYDLKPTFFAGEPIEDICPPPGNCPGTHTNRLLIRMQRTGNRIEVNDTLYIDIQNSVQVARCIRGRTDAGAATWDTRAVSNPDGTLTNLPFCDWGAGVAGDGGSVMTSTLARINISTLDYVRASLAPLYTCYEQRLVGVAVPGSWIEFENFGTAAEPSVPADQRAPVVPDFKVSFGETLKARFHLVLEDQRVTAAQKNRDAVPTPRLSGVIDGDFYFDLDRSRAAQPFP